MLAGTGSGGTHSAPYWSSDLRDQTQWHRITVATGAPACTRHEPQHRGNHDFGLCLSPNDQASRKYGEVVTAYMASLLPRLVREDCYFAHIEPWLDPEDLDDLWHFEGPPVTQSQRDRIFDAVPNRLMFAGHYHTWMLVRQDGVSDWDGRSPVRLSEDRFFVIINALCEGSYAVLDTSSNLLTPFNDA